MQGKFGFPTDPLTFTLFQVWYGIKWCYKHTRIFNKAHLIENTSTGSVSYTHLTAADE